MLFGQIMPSKTNVLGYIDRLFPITYLEHISLYQDKSYIFYFFFARTILFSHNVEYRTLRGIPVRVQHAPPDVRLSIQSHVTKENWLNLDLGTSISFL